jgi:hypothetical protein
MLTPKTTYTGSGESVPPVALNQAKAWYNMGSSSGQRNDFLNHFGRLLVTALFLDRRLIALTQVNLIDFENQPPQHDFHALYNNDEARRELTNETEDSFGKGVWPDMSRGNILCLRVSEGRMPGPEDRLSTKKCLHIA